MVHGTLYFFPFFLFQRTPLFVLIATVNKFADVMAIGREAILMLYRNLTRESKKWQSYNYRMYTLRKIRAAFEENKSLEDSESIEEKYNHGVESLAMLKRQVTIGNLYSTRPLVIETKSPAGSKSVSYAQ